MTALVALTAASVALAGCVLALHSVRRFGGITPLAMFIAVELLVVWPAGVLALLQNAPYGELVLGSFAIATFSLLLAHSLVWYGVRPRLRFGEDPRHGLRVPAPHLRWEDAAFRSTIMGTVLVGLTLTLYQGLPPLLLAVFTSLAAGEIVETARMMGQARLNLTRWEALGDGWRGQGALATMLRLGWPVVIASLLIAKPPRGAKWKRLVAVVVSGILAVFALGGAGQRAPLAYAAAAVFFTLSWARPLRVSRELLTHLTVVLLLLAGVSFLTPKFQVVRGSDAPVVGAATSLLERVAVGNGRNNVVIIQRLEANRLAFQSGAIHYQRFGNALPGVRVRQSFSNQLAQMETGDHQRLSQHSATYIGYLYAEGGLSVVILGYTLMGLALAIGASLLAITSSRAPAHLLPWLGTWGSLLGLITLFDFSGLFAGTTALGILLAVSMIVGRTVSHFRRAKGEDLRGIPHRAVGPRGS